MIDRRDFIKLAGCFGISTLLANRLWDSQAQADDIRVRPNISAVMGDSEYMAAYRKGVELMKSRPDTDPTSWWYWANVHMMPEVPPVEMIGVWNMCQHHTDYFLSWHRAYIYLFEQVLRSATGLERFNIPYWDWYNDPVVPLAFRNPVDGNTLWHERNTLANNGGSLDPKKSLGKSMWGTETKDLIGSSLSFSHRLEFADHDVVHGRVGTNILNGVPERPFDMGSVSRSARDPIFWLHHVNIDRLWTVWTKMGDGRLNPDVNNPWSQKYFIFPNDGFLTKNIVDSQAAMKYKYDNETLEPSQEIPLRPPVIASSGSPASTSGMAPMSSGHKVMSMVNPIELSLESGTVSMPIPAAESNVLGQQVMGESPAGKINSLMLYIEGIQLTEKGRKVGAEYVIFLNLPVSPDGDSYESHYLETITSFGLTINDSHDHGESSKKGITLSFQLIGRLAKLGATKSWDKGSIFISFVTPVEIKVDEPLVEISGMRIESSTLPTE